VLLNPLQLAEFEGTPTIESHQFLADSAHFVPVGGFISSRGFSGLDESG